ncbi:serine/threonine-protein kinase tousled-like 2 isoform X2 [Acropora millepora]|nr:serine/threonine-protein kinase tousled-like 2 isoform X2 [Acropora millepora]
MEPFAQNKAGGTKKVIIASSNSSSKVLRSRPSKGSSSPRLLKSLNSKSYAGNLNADGSMSNSSWSTIGNPVSIGNSNPEKSPLGLYPSGNPVESTSQGMQLDATSFSPDASIAKFNATLFSSADNHGNEDIEEAMDIDHQDVGEGPSACCSSTSQGALVLPEGNVSVDDPPRQVVDESLAKEPAAVGDETSDSSNTKPILKLHVRQEERPLTSNQKKRASPANSDVEQTQRPVSSNSRDKQRPIYLVLHVSTVKIGDLVGKATAPVKIYAEKVFIEMETNEGNGCKSISYHFRIPCKDLSECKVNFDSPPFVLVLKPTTAGLSAILGKCKEKGKFLDPDSQDAKKRYIVLVMNYKVMPRDVKADLPELFQSRLAGHLKWIELSSKQAQECLDSNEETRIGEEETSTQSTKPPSLANKDQRKILTPTKGRNTGKKLFVEENKSSPSDAASSIATANNEPSRSEQPKLTDQSKALDSTIVTRSRRRKSPEVVNSKTEEPVPNCVEPVKPDILRHHKEIESHITLLDQHSKEQRENLQQHQRLLREVEEEKERNLGRMRDLEISYSADKERLLERIRALEGVLNEKDQALTQQSVNLSSANEELEKEKASVSRLQNEIEKEREANSLLPVLRSDLSRLQSESQDTQAVRNMLEQQLSEKEVNFRALQANLGEEQQERQRLEEELLQSRRTCAELERGLDNERLLSQSNQQAAQTKEETIREQMRQLEQERELKLGLEERVRGLRTEVDEERIRRVSTERELLQERNILQQNRENLERERETYEQRIRESERTLADSERRLGELQSAVSVAEEALAEYRRRGPCDWIIQRDEVIISEIVLGTGAWGKVYQGRFRGCQVAVKQIHDLILSPHNRRLFEREMSIASRCRHPNLLQFMGATNDDGSPLFVTELLDTDLRKVLSQRSLHHEEIVCLALDVAIALNYLHLNKPFPIIHRDISSSNVLLWRRDDRWRAKLSDYGAANFMRQFMTCNPGARIYAAPEALTSQQSPKVDVYSFGLLLCEMCIRELPVPQQIQEQIGLVTNGVLRELVMRCVMRAPDARPTMNDVITVLTQQAETLNAQGLVTL